MAMQSGILYNVYVKWTEKLASAEIKLSWNESGSFNAIPSQYYVYPHEVGSGNSNSNS